jgi:hypothetical protein
VISTKPSRRFILGTLASRKENSEDSMVQDEGRASVRARRLKVSFLVKRSSVLDNSNISIKLTGHLYYPIDTTIQKESVKEIVDDEDEEEEEPEHTTRKGSDVAWKRLKFETQLHFNGSELDYQVKKVDFTNQIETANNDKKNYSKINDSDWNAEVSVGREQFGSENDIDIITIYLTNNAMDPTATSSRKERAIERTLFDCRLNVLLNNLHVEEFEDEYDYEGYSQKYFYDFRPVNCQAYWQIPRKNFITRHYGKYKQDSILPRQSLQGIDTSFFKLSSKETLVENLDKLLTTLINFNKIYEQNFKQEKNTEKFQPRFQNRQHSWEERRELIDQFHNMITRVEEGIQEIKTDPKTMNAFTKMNETFNLYYRNKGVLDGQWRLFQLIFILATLSSITKTKYIDVVDILHVNTGGGKSEAYFGLAVFACFYERACGKQDGVTAIVKFPLRMLSIQQLERISGIIIYADFTNFL